MSTSNNFFILFVVSLILFGRSYSECISMESLNTNSSPQELEEVSEQNALHTRTVDDVNDFIKLHPRIYVEQLVLSNVGGRLQYVLGARIAGKFILQIVLNSSVF